MVQKKKIPMVLKKDENIQVTSDQCSVFDEVFRAIGKREKIRTRLIKLTLIISAVDLFVEKSNQFLNELHLPRFWDFLSCKICFNDILFIWKLLLEWADIIDNESMNISKECTIVINNICLVILSEKKIMYRISSHQKLIFAVMQKQVMYALPWTRTIR